MTRRATGARSKSPVAAFPFDQLAVDPIANSTLMIRRTAIKGRGFGADGALAEDQLLVLSWWLGAIPASIGS
jgi:hypothetical protein